MTTACPPGNGTGYTPVSRHPPRRNVPRRGPRSDVFHHDNWWTRQLETADVKWRRQERFTPCEQQVTGRDKTGIERVRDDDAHRPGAEVDNSYVERFGPAMPCRQDRFAARQRTRIVVVDLALRPVGCRDSDERAALGGDTEEPRFLLADHNRVVGQPCDRLVDCTREVSHRDRCRT